MRLFLAITALSAACAGGASPEAVLLGAPPTAGEPNEPSGGGHPPSTDAAPTTHVPEASTPSPPRDSASPPPPAVDAGHDAHVSSQDAFIDPALPDSGATCTSGMTWTVGNTAEMRPGEACVTCHVLGGQASGYEFDVAGTVYTALHEMDDCDGTSSATVVITDAKQSVHMLSVNSAGNFYNFDYLGVGAIPTPFQVKVVVGSQERPMLTPVTDGDCNSCHTAQGANSAPGRIVTP